MIGITFTAIFRAALI